VKRPLARLMLLLSAIPDLRLWIRLRHGRRSESRRVRILFGVHGYYPQLGGCESHVQWMAESLSSRGYECYVFAPRRIHDPRSLNGITLVASPWVARYCDVVFTYSQNEPQQLLGRYVAGLQPRPRWLHYPCAMEAKGLELIRNSDTVIAMTGRDAEITRSVCGGDEKVARVRPASHACRVAPEGGFRERFGIRGDFILWAGGWTRAKGVRNLSERFAQLRQMCPDTSLKLVMFGAYGGDEFPIEHPDIIRFDRNASDLPGALRDCLFLAFNSPAPPIGFDANPLILLEALMSGKTFVAQSGAPLLKEIAHLGFVVENDADWIAAAKVLLTDEPRRAQLESACLEAARSTYNFANMMGDIEVALGRLAEVEPPINVLPGRVDVKTG
jgi:glycosyltransferase involved in cell wall biosynthesis